MSENPAGRAKLLGKRLASYQSLPPSPYLLGLWFLSLILLLWQIVRRTHLGDTPEMLASVTLTALLGVACWRQRPRRLELYQHGIECIRGSRRSRVFWNQVYEVYQTPLYQWPWRRHPQTQAWMYKIIKRDGRSVRLYHLESIWGLGQRIQQQVAARLTPNALEAYHAGYLVRFGRRLSVSNEGIHVGRRFIRWNDIAEITFDQSQDLRVFLTGQDRPDWQLSAARIPNLIVLDRILQVASQSRTTEDLDQQRGAFGEDDGSSQPATAGSETISGQLLTDGYDWNDLQDLESGNVTLDELMERGPRGHRPRHPR